MDLERMEKLAKDLLVLSVDAELLGFDTMVWSLRNWADETVKAIVAAWAAEATTETEGE